MPIEPAASLARSVRAPWLWPAFLVALYASAMVLAHAERIAYTSALTHVGVPTTPTAFEDVRHILAALECRRRGIDPLSTNPCDPAGLPLAYPRIWLALRHLPLDQSWTTALGLLVGALFYGAAGWLLRGIPLRHAPVCLGLLLSPALLLLVERANNDAVMFSLLVVAVTLIASARPGGRAVGYALTLGAALLKLYPVVGAVAALRERPRHSLLIIGSMGTVFAGYCLAIRDSLAVLERTRARGLNYSYGLDVFRALIEQVGVFNVALEPMPAVAVSYGTLVAVLLLGYGWARRLAREDGGHGGRLEEPALAFLVGAAVFGATFLAGDNWNYRLVFLLFCLPQLSAWLETPCRRQRFAAVALVALVVAVWAGFVMPVVLVRSIRLLAFPLVDQLADWLVLLCLWTGTLVLLPPEYRRALRLDAAAAPPAPPQSP